MGFFNEDEENKKPVMSTDEIGNFLKSNPVPPPAAPIGIADQYTNLAKEQDAGIQKAQEGADSGNMIANILKGLSGVANADTISRGGKGYDVSNFDKIVDANNARVKAAQAGKESALGDLKNKFNLNNMDLDRKRGDERYGQEKIENQFKNNANQSSAESIDPNSAISKQAVLTGKAILLSKAKQAGAAGDKQAADMLMNQAGQLEGLSAAKVSDLINMNKSLDYENVLNRQHADKLESRRDKKAETAEQRAKFDMESKIRSQLQGTPAFKNYQEISGKRNALEQLKNLPTGPKDEAFIVNFQKSIDPGSVVREGEFARTREGASLISRFDMAMESLRSGKRLTPELREQIYAAAADLQNAAKNHLMNEAMVPYMKQAAAYQLTPENIFEPGLMGDKSVQQPAPQGQKPGVVAPAQSTDSTKTSKPSWAE